METWFMQIQSLCIVLLMTAGIWFRRNRQLHVKIMAVTIFWDILLILQIELSRSAILKASKAVNNELMLNIHVLIAVLTVVLYGFMIYSGRAMLSGRSQFREKHRRLGYTTYLMRILTFVTSFWAVVPKE
jgi:hypothetical protein